MNTFRAKLFNLIELETGKPVNDATALDDLGDSLDLISLFLAVGEGFDAAITDEQAQGWVTVGDMAKWLESRA